MSTLANRVRHGRLLAAGLLAVLAITLGVLGGFTTVVGPSVAAYFFLVLVWTAFEDASNGRHDLAWGVGFFLCGVALTAHGEVTLLTAVFPFVGTAIVGQHAYQLVDPED